MRFQDLKETRRLRTQKGSVIKRSKYGVGKDIGGKIYVHKNYVQRLPNYRDIIKADKFLRKASPTFKYNAVASDMRSGKITFFEAPDFDTADEPTVGRYMVVSPEGDVKSGISRQIWHHKWLWVEDDYQGFDVEKSFQRSKKWLSLPNIDFSRIGNPEFWNQQIAGKL